MNEDMSVPPVISGGYETVNISALKHHPKNARQGDIGAIYESIRANGFYGACVVQRSTGYILIGNHRAAAARKLRIPAVPVVYVDCDDDHALRIMLSDNRTGDLANDNPAALADLLQDLAGSDKGLLGTGYNGDFLDDLLGDLNRPADFSGLTAPPTPPDRIEREPQPRIPHEADKDRDGDNPDPADSREEKTRLGVVIIVDNEDEQDHVYRHNVDLGWSPSKTRFSEQSYTQVKYSGLKAGASNNLYLRKVPT